MQFDDEHIYDTPLKRIEVMYFDPAFVPRKFRELGMQDVVVRSEQPAPDMHVSCSLRLEPSVKVPGPLKKFIGDGLVPVRWTDRWDTRTHKGQLEIALHPFPSLSIHCDMSLAADPRGAVNRMHWTVECTTPVIGGMIAKFMARDIEKKSEADLAMSKQILEAYY